jgi:quercetin dioxygenase-like cupin family protein
VPDRKSEAFYAEFQNPEQASRPHQHKGTELIYVLAGQLVVDLGGEETKLGEGDAITFDSGHPHSYRRRGRAPCSAIVVVTP